MLGNLTVEQIEQRSGVTFNDELKELLGRTHQPSASNIKDGKWHCFDVPFTMACGGAALAKEICSHLESESKNFKEPLRIALS